MAIKFLKIPLLVAALLCGSNPAFAQTWTQTSVPSNDWVSVVSSADGSKLAAAGGLANGGNRNFYGDGLIYVSTNLGVDWMQTSAPTNTWSGVASSADGTKLAATASGDFIYTSTNSGSDWATTSAPSNSWAAVASSADGATLDAVANGDGIYFSTNSGLDWTESDAPVTNWNSIACSADGTKAIAASSSQVWISEDSGATWIQTDLPSLIWSSVCSSADGNKLATVGLSTTVTLPGGGRISTYGGFGISTDSGETWIINTNFSANRIVSSADGNKLIAINGSGIYTSTDSGATWTQETNISDSVAIACSADENKIVVAALGTMLTAGGRLLLGPGPIYISFSTPSPQLNIVPTNSSFQLSWIIPSTNFVMQQSSDLASWSDVTNTPVLNLTNLQDQITVAPSNSNGFYRLATP
jgi:hypothetical protein